LFPPSEETLARNLSVVVQTSPEAARAIVGCTAVAGIELHETEEDAPGATLVAAINGRTVRRQLCSLHRPLEEARVFADAIDLQTTGCAVILGFGIGHHVAATARRMHRVGIVRVFEPDVALLRAVFERIDCTDWLRLGNVAIHIDADDVGAIARSMGGCEALPTLGTKLVLHAPSKARLGMGADRYAAAFATVMKAVRTNIVTTLVQVESTLRNELQNLDHYATVPGIVSLRGSAKGRTAIVVAAGPSLTRNIDLLTRPGARDRFVIIAVQTVLKQLLARGIRPHFVTAIDHHEISRRFYDGLTKEDVEGITLIADSKCNAAILEAFPGDIRCPSEGTLDRILGQGVAGGLARPMGELPPGSTVAHAAYYFARFLGCDPVIFIGQDLGFTDGQYYSAGAAIHDVWSGELNEFNTLEMLEWQRIARMKSLLRTKIDQLGRPIYTDEQMSAYLVQFERDFAADRAKGLSIIDATEGGVAKQHTEILPLDAAMERFAPPAESSPLAFPREERLARSRVKQVLARVRSLRGDVLKVADLSRETVSLLERMLACHDDQGAVNPLIEKAHVIRERVVGLKDAYWLVQFLNQTGTLNRFRADRAMLIDTQASEHEQQRRQIERDLQNVKWLLDSAAQVGRMLEDAMRSLDGAAKITRDATMPSVEPVDGVPSAAAVRIRIGIVVHADLGFGGLGTRRTIDSAHNLLSETLSRLASCAGADAIVVATPEVDSARSLCAGIPADLRSRLLFSHTDEATIRRHARAIGAARLWSRSCWRGGLGNMSCYDEVMCPSILAAVMREHGLDAAAVVGADWCEVDPALVDQAIVRVREDPERHHLTFVHAPPGLGTAVLSRAVVDELAANGGVFASIGGLLGYIPVAPQSDPIAKPACISAPAIVRDLSRRFVADGAIDGAAAKCCDKPSVLHLCVASLDALGEVVLCTEAEIERALAFVRSRPDVAVTIEGGWDAALHPELAGILTRLREAGAAGLHLRTHLTCDPDLAEQLFRLVDVLSVDLVASDVETYRAILNRDHPSGSHPFADLFEVARANFDLLMTLRDTEMSAKTLPTKWILPRIRRRDEVYEQIEGWYDEHLMRCGCAVIDPHEAGGEADRIRALPVPRAARERIMREVLRIAPSTDLRGAATRPAGLDVVCQEAAT
jgi:hypothetical protein